MAAFKNSSRSTASATTIVGEAADVSKETMESWNKRAREIIIGWNARDVWSMDEESCFWRSLPEKP